MANKIHITSPDQLQRQEEGFFSVQGNKTKFLDCGHSKAIFAVFANGKYTYNKNYKYNKNATDGLIMVNLSAINEESPIYKLGSMKRPPRGSR